MLEAYRNWIIQTGYPLGIVRTRFGLDPKTRMDPGPQSLNNKFVECRVTLKIKRYISVSAQKVSSDMPQCSFLEYFSVPIPFSLLHLIYYGFFTFFPVHVWTGRFLLPFLESSILSWKAARSLFRYHLHINAARRLVGRHLMRR